MLLVITVHADAVQGEPAIGGADTRRVLGERGGVVVEAAVGEGEEAAVRQDDPRLQRLALRRVAKDVANCQAP